ncbi:MAG: GNAT family N-acetyltransferase [Bacillus sp. (in: firmicutes)]
MLIRYKKSMEKIAMGLLSFMPNEKDVKKLQATIKQYETMETWHLYLWKEEEDMLGLIGLAEEEGDKMLVQHLTVNPSFRSQGIGKKMVCQIEQRYQDKTVVPNEETAGFLEKCQEAEKK